MQTDTLKCVIFEWYTLPLFSAKPSVFGFRSQSFDAFFQSCLIILTSCYFLLGRILFFKKANLFVSMNFFATVFIVFTLFTIINSKPGNPIEEIANIGNDVLDNELPGDVANVPGGPIVVALVDGIYDHLFGTS